MIFFVKNCLSRCPYSDQGVATELSWRSITFLRCSWWRFSALSWCFHCASTALTVHAPRFHGVATALMPCWRRSDISKNAVQYPCKRHGRPRRLHNDPCVRPRSSYCVVGDPAARLWWPYGVPSALYKDAERTPSDGVCFEYAQSAHRRSAFYATPPCPMAMPLRCCGDACVRTARYSAFCNFLGHRGITVRTPPWCDRGFTSVDDIVILQGFY